jgi:hypothetical protein
MKSLYTYLQPEDQKYLSLSFLFSKEVISNSLPVMIRGVERKCESIHHNSRDFQIILFYKHISRYIENIEDYPIEKLDEI